MCNSSFYVFLNVIGLVLTIKLFFNKVVVKWFVIFFLISVLWMNMHELNCSAIISSGLFVGNGSVKFFLMCTAACQIVHTGSTNLLLLPIFIK